MFCERSLHSGLSYIARVDRLQNLDGGLSF